MLLSSPAVHPNLSQNGINHLMRQDDMTSHLEEVEESVDAEPVLLDDDSPGYRDISPSAYHRRSPPHRSVSESELTRVRARPPTLGSPKCGELPLKMFVLFSNCKNLQFSGIILLFPFIAVHEITTGGRQSLDNGAPEL